MIMPCRDAMPFLPWAVDDLARSVGCRLEVLVCDDGSTDGPRRAGQMEEGGWFKRLSTPLSPVRDGEQ